MKKQTRKINHWLCLDIGNTHTVAGLFDVNCETRTYSLKHQARYRTDPASTPDEYRLLLSELFSASRSKFSRVIVSTVVPSLERTVRESFSKVGVLSINHTHQRDFTLDLPFPEQLGADRLANVAGALRKFQLPFVIIDAGTATTFCCIDREANYFGGAITPGLEISWKTLQSKAAKLYAIELKLPKSSVGNTTETQLQSGVLIGYECLIEGLTQRLIKDSGKRLRNATIIATGGITSLLELNERIKIAPDLTLEGLVEYGFLNA